MNRCPVGEFTFLASGKEAYGMTKYYMVLGLGTLFPSFVRVIYAQFRNHMIVRIINIWEKDLAHPPYPQDRQAEIKILRRLMEKVVRLQVMCVIIPITILTARPFVTGEEVIPTGFPGNHNESPTFEIITILIIFTAYYICSVWSAYEALQILFMKSIMAELNHLYTAMDKILDIVNESTHEREYKMFLHQPNEQNIREQKLTEVRTRLGIWVLHHQALLRFCNRVNEFLSPMLLLHNLCTIIFAFTALFTVIMGELRLENRIEAISYLIFYYFVLFHACKWGDEIQIKSMSITEKFQEKMWFLYPKDIIQNILFIQQVTMNRPIKIYANGFKDMSLRSFRELTQKGYELITCMSHIVRRDKT